MVERGLVWVGTSWKVTKTIAEARAFIDEVTGFAGTGWYPTLRAAGPYGTDGGAGPAAHKLTDPVGSPERALGTGRGGYRRDLHAHGQGRGGVSG